MENIFSRKPDIVITEEDAIAEGAVVVMDAWGIAEFRGEPVRTVSRALFDALQAAFGRAATAGAPWDMIREEYRGAHPEDGKTALVPPWATLGELLQVLTGNPDDLHGDNYLLATKPVAALGGQEIWFQRPKKGEWTAFLPSDY